LVNFRVPMLLTGAFALGIALAVLAEYISAEGLWFMLLAVLFVIAAIIYYVFTKNLYNTVIFLLAVLLFTAALVYALYLIGMYTERQFIITDALGVSGTVEAVEIASSGTRYLILKDVTFGGEEVYGKVVAYLLDTAEGYCQKGYKVSFYTQPEQLSFIELGSVDYRAALGIKYQCVIAGEITSEYGFSLFGRIASRIEELLFENLGEESASVCLAMLTGNTDMISKETLTAFRYGGIAHVFAVSGLHIGVVYGALTFVFKKVGVSRYVSAVIKVAFMVLYAGVCNFSSSSVRAVIMCSVLAASSCFNKKYDSLNAMSLAAFIILVIDPFALFKAGFVLSFSAMLGIAALSANMRKILGFLPAKIRGAFSVSLSAQLATTPSLIYYFGYVSVAGIFLNIIFIPLISAMYILLFGCMLASLIIPALAPVLIPFAAAPIELTVNIVYVCGFENAIASSDFGSGVFIPFILALLGITDKLNIRLFLRGALAFSGLTVLFIMATRPTYGNCAKVTFAALSDGGYVYVQSDSGNVLIVTEDVEELPDYYCDSADALIIVGGDDSFNTLFAADGSYSAVYMRPGLAEISPIGNYDLYYLAEFSVCGVAFEFDGDALLATVNGNTFYVVVKEKGESYGELPQESSLCHYTFGSYSPVLYTNSGSYALSKYDKLIYYFSCRGIISPILLN